jgi:hypothetical protein
MNLTITGIFAPGSRYIPIANARTINLTFNQNLTVINSLPSQNPLTESNPLSHSSSVGEEFAQLTSPCPSPAFPHK